MKGFKLFLALLAVCVVVGGGGVAWLWRRYGSEIQAELDRVREDSRVFAAAHEQEDCVPEAFARLEVCDSTWCRVQTPIFTRECLRAAANSPELCESVPDSIARALVWPTTTCADIDAPAEICQRILRELVYFCVAGSER